MTHQLTRTVVRLCVTLFVVCIYAEVTSNTSFAQEIQYQDRIGSNKDFDMCEDFRFKQISKLVTDGKIPQRQGYNIWKRIESNKEAVKKVLGKAVAANELTQVQADRLLPLVDMEMTYFDSQHGRFGQPKELTKGQFEADEVSAKNREAVYQRLIAANQRGEMYDYDMASIMKQLYAGFDSETASVEEIAKYRGALNPRIAQSGSQARVLQSAQMQRDRSRSKSNGYGAGEIKIADPADWIKNLEKPVYSGPQPGEKVPSLSAINLRGDQIGKPFDPVDLAGDKLHLMFFVSKSRTFGRFLGQLSQQLQSIEEKSKQPWTMSVIVCNDDANEVEKSFTVLDQRYPKNLVVGLCKEGAAGPPAYGLDKNLTATVIVVRDGKVVHNLPYAGDAFYTQPHILGAIASAMKVDHDTLRKYISGKSGDAASAYGRRMQGDGEKREPAQNNELREKLAQWVQSDTITRGEAGELFRLAGDKVALRTKVVDMVKAGKLSREAAAELFGSARSGSEQGREDRDR